MIIFVEYLFFYQHFVYSFVLFIYFFFVARLSVRIAFTYSHRISHWYCLPSCHHHQQRYSPYKASISFMALHHMFLSLVTTHQFFTQHFNAFRTMFSQEPGSPNASSILDLVLKYSVRNSFSSNLLACRAHFKLEILIEPIILPSVLLYNTWNCVGIEQ